MSALTQFDKDWCQRKLAELNKWALTTPFRYPVDPVRDGAERYLEIVTNPMDLNTMKKKLTDNVYKTVDEFVQDVHLISDNAIKFNGENSMYAFIATDMKTWIDEQYKQKATSIEDEWHRKLTDVVERLLDHVKNAPIHYRGEGAAALAQAATAMAAAPPSA
ncbi:Bromodomain containing protein [Tritrichomonas foetus]|uniref:Bromodomain containing protein n=1 Tax=Tritrichomonas foetus TaxID=1144522 RepID=A0A1J4JIK1_9EUKA|nr:Bromodomain containing protein [Tritrichomonas foetus]|eukprot:OHS98513.1 Bromodomain containing protein [Tritrichomonas foetus]